MIYNDAIRKIIMDKTKKICEKAKNIYAIEGISERFIKLENKVITSKNAKLIYTFACEVEGADIDRLTDAIVATNNAKYIYWFARDVKGANIEKLTYGIIATGIIDYIILFARYIPGANMDKLSMAIQKFGDNLPFTV